MKKLSSIILASLLFSSCVDTIILPDDKTVDEDFWQTKADVAAMVNGAYNAMGSSDVLTRLILWGGFRGDEYALVKESDTKGSIMDALEEIEGVNIQTTNTYATWASLYSVINKCNIVLERQQEVPSIDPNYTIGDMQVHRSQMLALRSLCYFYLVRAFRDVPYNTQAFMNSSQDMELPQQAPDVVLQNCLRDLEEAEANALSPNAYTTSQWRRVGWITRDGINALQADIYLWLASVHHSKDYYQKCVDYCEKVIESKKSQHVIRAGRVEDSEFPLASATEAFSNIFAGRNAEESIFELQVQSNSAVATFFHKFKNNNSTYGYLRASNIFSETGAVYGNQNNRDLRMFNNVFSGSESFDIRKMVSNGGTITARETRTSRSIPYAQNYIFYRLTDVMLMRAEALVQLMDDDTDLTRLRTAYYMVQAVNTRSIKDDAKSDSLKWTMINGTNTKFNTKADAEKYIMLERQRELCFEGKRWYDLLRYHYRHVEGTQYDKTMAQITQEGGTFPEIYQDMKVLMTQSKGNARSGIQAKMKTEPYLYMPIPQTDINVSPVLVQNPVWSNSNEYEKSY